MSSTNRSKANSRHIADYYVTPVSDIQTFLSAFLKDEPDALSGLILDPCAGGDMSHPMSYPLAIRSILPDADIRTVDIREDSLAETHSDYLALELDYKPNIIITNPPFGQALEIIQKSLDDVADGGFVIMLLRLNFFGSKTRFPFWQEPGHMPKYAYVHHSRMSFIPGSNSTDSIEYAHMVWQKGVETKFTQLRVI